MNELVLAKTTADWRRLKALVLDSVSSPITKRVYNLGLDELFERFGRETRSGFNKATVSAWRVALEARRLGSISVNPRITAVRKLAVEAADRGAYKPRLGSPRLTTPASRSMFRESYVTRSGLISTVPGFTGNASDLKLDAAGNLYIAIRPLVTDRDRGVLQPAADPLNYRPTQRR